MSSPENLDINTPRGQVSREYEARAIERIRGQHGSIDIIETDKMLDAKVDAILVRDNSLVGVAEIKCRDESVDSMKQWGSWLITHQKLLDGQQLSKMLRCYFFGFLYTIKDDRLLRWTICGPDGDFRFEFEVKNTATQKTINGGSIVRTNAYLPIEYAREVK
jgi:hypothetical protein